MSELTRVQEKTVKMLFILIISRCDNPGNAYSYFGYSIALAGNEWVIVGAPRDNSSDLPSIDSPGALHKCSVSDGKGSCDLIRIDSKFGSDSAEMNGRTLYFDHGRTQQWLGGALTVKGSTTTWEIVTCAHKWYNRRFESSGEYDMNGFCYLIPSDLNTANIRKIPAMVGSSKRTQQTSWGEQVYNYGMASMGLSLHVTNEKQNILFGAPGVKYWTGGFVEMAGRTLNYMESNLERVNDTHDSYIGYALTSGRYFSDRQIYYAVGAPRAGLVGKVIFFKSNTPPFVLENADFELNPMLQDKKSVPMNAYFGSVLCTVDVNSDGLDDLFVGVPMFTHDMMESDAGAVYLYFGTSVWDQRFSFPDLILNGAKESRARFGSAVASLGDINSDGFNDIVVGAPYEDEGRGAVYVYNGYKDGLWPTYSLKIMARDLDDGLLAFGASFSNQMDMNRDSINDIAIGSYLSSNVILFYGQPVIQVDAWIEIEVSGKTVSRGQKAMIKQDTTQIFLKTCFKFSNSDTQSLTLNVTLTLDKGFEPKPRLLFQSSSLEERHLRVKVWEGERKCTKPKNEDFAYIQSTNDLVTPVAVLAKYEIDTMQYFGGEVKPTINKFNGHNPKEPLLEVTRELQFLNDCDENICNTDLHLNASLDYNGVDGFFIMGSKLMTIKLKITKDGDPSYGSVCSITFPSFLRFKKAVTVSGTTDVSCDTKSNKGSDKHGNGPMPRPENTTILCDFGNPLYNDSGVEFQVLLQVPAILPELLFGLVVNAATLSQERNLNDNDQEFLVEATHYVRAFLSGISDPQTIFIKNKRDQYIVKHIYEFANQGPSALPRGTVRFYIPNAKLSQGSHPLLFLNSSVFEYSRFTELTCSVHQAASSPPVYMWRNGRLKAFVNEDAAARDAIADECTTAPCSYVECNVTNVPARTTLVSTLSFVIHHTIMEGKTLMLLSRGLVQLDETNVITERLRFEKTLNTELLPETPPKEEVDIWIIIVSVSIGVLLLVLLMFILYKIGFFKRRMKAELERQKLEKTNSVKSTKSQTKQEDRKEILANSEVDDAKY